MSFLDLFRREQRAAGNTWTPAHPVTVASVEAREAATELTVENLAVAQACVSVISSTVSAFPVLVYKREETGRVEQPGHWLQRIVRNGPNDFQTWGGLIESALASVELYGNAVMEIIRAGDGTVEGLRFLPWSWIAVELLPTRRLAFDVYEPTQAGGAAVKRRLLAHDVIHLKDRSDDGILGRSRLSRARDVFLTASSQQVFARQFLENGAQPSGVIKHPGTMTPEQKQSLRSQFTDRHSGAVNSGRALILDGGLEWQASQVSPEDAELLGSRRFAVEEIARIFGVPPPLVGDLSHGTFTNSREAARWFGQFTLTPRVRRLEAELSRALLGPDSGLEIEFDMSSLLRSDPETRWASHRIAVETGTLDTDEIRELEGYNPRGRTDNPGEATQ